jgi:ABC-type ATPase with predicted acetyltransferase domain
MLSLRRPHGGEGVIVTGRSGAGKTTLLAELLGRPGHPSAVINDDWGAVSLSTGYAVNTGERQLHMKSASVLAMRPDFYSVVLRRSYAPDLSDPDPSARPLVAPRGVTAPGRSALGK